MATTEAKVTWHGELGGFDDFGSPYVDVMYDGKTKMGPWANMTQESWERFGCGRLGTGYGQKYAGRVGGPWVKVEG